MCILVSAKNNSNQTCNVLFNHSSHCFINIYHILGDCSHIKYFDFRLNKFVFEKYNFKQTITCTYTTYYMITGKMGIHRTVYNFNYNL